MKRISSSGVTIGVDGLEVGVLWAAAAHFGVTELHPRPVKHLRRHRGRDDLLHVAVGVDHHLRNTKNVDLQYQVSEATDGHG